MTEEEQEEGMNEVPFSTGELDGEQTIGTGKEQDDHPSVISCRGSWVQRRTWSLLQREGVEPLEWEAGRVTEEGMA